jgi:hypothetical protein
MTGENEAMVGTPKKEKPAELTDPPVFATVTLPVAPVPTRACIWVPSEFAEKLWATVLPKLTVVRFVKFVPVIVTVVPGPPFVGLKPAMVGAGEIASEIVICPLFTAAFRETGGELLSQSVTLESVKATVPLASEFAVICSIYTLPVPVGPGEIPVTLSYPPKRLIET